MLQLILPDSDGINDDIFRAEYYGVDEKNIKLQFF